MSHKRRQRGNINEDLLGDLASNEVENGNLPAFGSNSAADIADFGYSTAVGHDDRLAQMTNREKIVFKPIDAIHPNRTQPRRALPSTIRHYFTASDMEAMAYGFQLWLKEVEIERGSIFPLADYLAGEATQRVTGIEDVDTALDKVGSAPKLRPLETALMQVVELAASIKRDGLINPISIARSGSTSYEIETGERRWFAYHLLNWRYPDDGWGKIPTRQVEGGVSIWRQANENNIRADLNAISMARQFALLLMDILRDEKEFQPFDAFEHEQDFYAQVADGAENRVPRNQGEKLLNAMNLENPVQLRQYRALLRLPRPIWEWADDLNWTEGFIRMEILGKAQTAEDKILLAYKQAKIDHHTVTGDTVYEELLQEIQPSSKVQPTSPSSQNQVKKHMNWLATRSDMIPNMSRHELQKASERISDIRQWLEELESKIAEAKNA